MEIPTQQNHVYTLTCDNACEVYDVDTDRLIHEHHAGEVQSQFTAIGMKVSLTDDTAHITELFNGAPAGNGGGGYIESHLNVGHGAADAVAAVCTLTLGDLATGGTLEDSNGQSVELENPHKYATGTVSIPDATAAGTLTIGEWSKAWETQPGAYALGYFLPVLLTETQLGGTLKLMRGEEVVYSHEFAADEGGAPWTIASVKAELEADENWPCTITDEENEIDFLAQVAGTSWNDVELVLEGDLFDNGEVYHDGMSGGGEGARTAVDVFNDIHGDENCPVGVSLDADELGLSFTAKEYGVNDEIAITGSIFSDAVGMSGGHGDYTIDELLLAIYGEFDDITPTEGEVEGTIVLTSTATEHQADANRITYKAEGCFGDGTVKQGSTTRGKNAVAQTDFGVIINGVDLLGGATVVSGNWTFSGELELTGSLNGFNAEVIAALHATPSKKFALYHNTAYTNYGSLVGFSGDGAKNIVTFARNSGGRQGLFFDYITPGSLANIFFENNSAVMQTNALIKVGRCTDSNSAGRRELHLVGTSLSLRACTGTVGGDGDKTITLTATELTKLENLLTNADALLALLS